MSQASYYEHMKSYAQDLLVASMLRRAADRLEQRTFDRHIVDRTRRIHVLRVLAKCDGNISETARVLNLHRRQLQRWLTKWKEAK